MTPNTPDSPSPGRPPVPAPKRPAEAGSPPAGSTANGHSPAGKGSILSWGRGVSPGPRPLPPSSASESGRRARPRADLLQPRSCRGSPEPQARAQSPEHPPPRTRPLAPRAPGSLVGPLGAPLPAPTPRSGQVPGLRADTHPRPPLPVRSHSRRLALAPAVCSRGGSGPALLPRPTPPRVRAARGRIR